MSRILILFASAHGATRSIAMTLRDRLRHDGHDVDAVDVHAQERAPDGYDAVLLGSRVELGRHDRALTRYAHRHREALGRKPAGFFSVSMSAADGADADQPRAYLEHFFRATGWRPPLAASFAGGLPYTQYGPILRPLMKAINRRAGHSTDTGRDHSYTDWSAVDRFAADFARAVTTSRTVGPSATSNRPAVAAKISPSIV